MQFRAAVLLRSHRRDRHADRQSRGTASRNNDVPGQEAELHQTAGDIVGADPGDPARRLLPQEVERACAALRGWAGNLAQTHGRY